MQQPSTSSEPFARSGICSVCEYIIKEDEEDELLSPFCLRSSAFSLFINDIYQGLDPGVRHEVYADDLQINVQRHFEDLHDILAKLSRKAERLADCAVITGLFSVICE